MLSASSDSKFPTITGYMFDELSGAFLSNFSIFVNRIVWVYRWLTKCGDLGQRFRYWNPEGYAFNLWIQCIWCRGSPGSSAFQSHYSSTNMNKHNSALFYKWIPLFTEKNQHQSKNTVSRQMEVCHWRAKVHRKVDYWDHSDLSPQLANSYIPPVTFGLSFSKYSDCMHF